MSFTQIKLHLSVILFFVSILFLVPACCAKKEASKQTSNSLIKACPEEWFQNRMPGPGSNEASEYFIYEGKRRELKEFDVEWIKKNCDVKPQIVQ